MRWTLVTGAAKGLGSAICLELAKNKYPVVIHYRTHEKQALDLQEQCIHLGAKAEVIQGDFSSTKSTERFIDAYTSRFFSTAHLINNVGNYLTDPILEASIEKWQDLYQTNLFSQIQIIQALKPIITSFSGTITNIGVAGIQGVPADLYAPVYTSCKLALWMVTKSLAKELVASGVRVNMVSPGYLENAIDLPKDLTKLPQKRAVRLEEAASVVAFLLDEKNSSITGQNIEVAGGIRI